jgi:hypothetical protein
VAVLGLGAVAGLQARSAFDAEKKAAAAGDSATYWKKRDEAGKNAKIADVCFVVGGLSAGFGAYLVLTGAPAVAVVPAEGGLVAVYSGRF